MPAFHGYPRDFTAKGRLVKLAGHTRNSEIIGFDQHLITGCLAQSCSPFPIPEGAECVGVGLVPLGVMAHEDTWQCPR